MAVSRRLRRSEGVPPPLHRRSLPDRRGRALLPVAWEPFPNSRPLRFRSCSTPAGPSSTGTRARATNVPILERLSPNAWLEMNLRDARAWGSRRRTAWTSSRSADAQRRAPGDRDHRSRPGLHAVSLRRGQCPIRRRARSIRFSARAELQTVRRASRRRWPSHEASGCGRQRHGSMACLEQILKYAHTVRSVFGTKRTSATTASCCRRCSRAKSADDIVLNSVEWYERHNINLRVGVASSASMRLKTVTGATAAFTRTTRCSWPRAVPRGCRRSTASEGRRLRFPRSTTRVRYSNEPAQREGGGYRWRPPGSRSRARTSGAGLRRHRGPFDVDVDGAPARSRRRLLPARQDGGAWSPCAARAHDDGDPWERAWKASRSPTTPAWRPISSWWPPVSNIELALKGGIAANRGILVNDYMEDLAPRHLCRRRVRRASRRLLRTGGSAYERGKCSRRRLPAIAARPTKAPYRRRSSRSWASTCSPPARSEQNAELVRFEIEHSGIYKKLTVRGGKLVDPGRRHVRQPSLHGVAAQQRGHQWPASISLFPPPAADAGLDIAEMPDSETVCGCLGVTKGTIIAAIHEQG